VIGPLRSTFENFSSMVAPHFLVKEYCGHTSAQARFNTIELRGRALRLSHASHCLTWRRSSHLNRAK
jgi:hypothetical protein